MIYIVYQRSVCAEIIIQMKPKKSQSHVEAVNNPNSPCIQSVHFIQQISKKKRIRITRTALEKKWRY